MGKGTALQAWLSRAICGHSAAHGLNFSALLRRWALYRCAVLAVLLLLLILPPPSHPKASFSWGSPPLRAQRSVSRSRWDPEISSGRLLSGGCEVQCFAPPG